MTLATETPAVHQRLGRGFTRKVMRGAVLLLPLMVTFWLIQFAFQTMDGLLQPIISAIAGDEIPGLSFAIIIVALFIVGALSSTLLFRTPAYLIERGITALPGVGAVYGTTKKLLPGSDPGARAPTGFDTVVRIEYPRKGVWSVGFLMGFIEADAGMKVGVVYMALDTHAAVRLACPAPHRGHRGDGLELRPGHAVHRLRRCQLPGDDGHERARGARVKLVRMALHLLIFAVAVVVFFLGLGIGLQYNPDLGTLLWIVAAAIAVANAVWMTRGGR